MSSMLHRSFKPVKCKTALKLAVSRMKIFKNKKEGEVRKLRKELAQLLQSGQELTARIRVEHVIREEKLMAAYDLVEIYCELIVARLPIIESQKNCPIDLKEAISSVIFASPRLSDIPELVDVRKQITSKYGKEFVSAAIELRPDCGLVEKLSAKAPDGPTKMKILTAVAEENNIKWEPNPFGENDGKSSQDLLVAPNNFEKASYVEPSQVHVSPVHDEKAPPDLRASSQTKPMHDTSTNSYEYNASGATRKVGGNQSTSEMSGPEIRPSGTGSHEKDFRDSNSENRSAFSTGKQNWNMEFKDAASAAQAAAESAEHASMAARAAAELSNREYMTRQYSSGSHSSHVSKFGEAPEEYAFHGDEHISTGSVNNNTFHRRDSGAHNEQITAREQDNPVGAPREYYRTSHENMVKRAPSASLSSTGDEHISTGSVNNNTFRRRDSGERNEQNTAREQNNPVGAPSEYYRTSHENTGKRAPSSSLSSSGDEHISTGSVNNKTFHRRDSGARNEQITAKEQDSPVGAPSEYYRTSHENTVKHAPSASLSSSGDEHISVGSVNNNTFHRRDSGAHNEQITAREQDNPVGAPSEYYSTSHENTVKRAPSASLSSSGSFGDNPFAHGSQLADTYQRNDSFEQENSDLHEMDIKTQTSITGVNFMTGLHSDDDLNTENSYHIGDATPTIQSRKASSSHLISTSYDHNQNLNSYDQKMGNKAVEDIFDTDEKNTQTNTMEANSYNDTSVAFDDSGSEDDDYKLDFENKYKGEGSSLFFSSPGSKPQVDPLENTSSWRHGQYFDEKESSSIAQSHSSIVSEKLTTSAISSEKEDLEPVTFDDSEDAGSDSEVNLVSSMVSGTSDYRNSVIDQSANHEALESSSRNDKNVGSDRKTWLLPSSVGSDSVEEQFEKKVEINTASDKTFGFGDLRTKQSSQLPDTFKYTETLEESHTENDMGLNYGMLKGGFRNKAHKRPPYIKNTSNENSSSLSDISVQNEKSFPTVRTSISSDAPVQDKYTREVSTGNRSAGLRNTPSDFVSHDAVSNSQVTPTSTHDPRKQKEQSEAKKKSSSRAPITYFDSDSNSEDEIPKLSSASLTQPVSEMSRRKSTPSKSGTGLSSGNAPSYKASVTSGTRLGWNSSRVSYENDNQKASYMMKSSENLGSSQPGSAEHVASKPISEPNRSPHEETMKSSARVQPSSSFPKTAIPDSEEGKEASKSLTSDGDTTPSKQKVAHVHPKLPEYDSLAAHFLSLKKDRQ
ncbi:hypothetical protein TanjilG_11338 [Lupinus angustifolius]|uniref:IST1-like protein n=1 Tax=Lupinus angustifolius TaxID=3871 RepID=A0A1J7H8N3_LUPAN|nr:hypothetical protein TanjilG_11338 [Lupinus angustifolius]